MINKKVLLEQIVLKIVFKNIVILWATYTDIVLTCM